MFQINYLQTNEGNFNAYIEGNKQDFEKDKNMGLVLKLQK